MSVVVQDSSRLNEATIPGDEHQNELRLSEVIGSLSYALDLTEGQPEGHALRSCLIGMRVAEELRMDGEFRTSLFYALLLKDLGCSSNAARLCSLFCADDHTAKCNLKTIDWTKFGQSFRYVTANVAPGGNWWQQIARTFAVALDGKKGARLMFQTRCDRGAEIARLLEFDETTALAIRHLDEHWDGRGQPQGLAGEEISLAGRILGLAQTVEVFFTHHGLRETMEMVRQRRGYWFDPTLADIIVSLKSDTAFWYDVAHATDRDVMARYEPEEQILRINEGRLDRIALGFARVVDAKSPWTFRHSEGVAEIAHGIGEVLGFAPEQLRLMKRAGLLHDIGKLGVSNLILDKPAKLTDDERLEMQKHPVYSERILRRVGAFHDIAELAWTHHERIDGRGYPRGLNANTLPLPVRVLVVADIFDALSAERPYRAKQPLDRVMAILKKDAGSAVCPECVEALQVHLARGSANQT